MPTAQAPNQKKVSEHAARSRGRGQPRSQNVNFTLSTAIPLHRLTYSMLAMLAMLAYGSAAANN